MKVGRVGVVLVLSAGALSCLASRRSVSSGQIGCDPSRITISGEQDHPGFGQRADTWVAECDGKRYYCSRLSSGGNDGAVVSQVSCKEASDDARTTSGAPAAPPTIARGPAPTGAAGFDLGRAVSDVQSACEAAGNTWQVSGADYNCSGPVVALGFGANVTLRACSGKVCGISLRHRPSSQWMTFVGDLKDKLEAKYGAASEADDLVPVECKGEDAFAACLDAGTLKLRFGWSWPSGERVALVAGRLHGAQAASVLIEYSKPVDSGL